MEIAQRSRFQAAQVKSHDFTILFGYAAFAALLLIGIYFGSLSSGTVPGDFAAMVILP